MEIPANKFQAFVVLPTQRVSRDSGVGASVNHFIN